MNIPENLKFTKDHEWIRPEGDEAVVGITDYAQSELGDIVFVDINTVGETLSQGDVFGAVDAVKTASDIFMPVGGEVLAVNDALEGAPELVNQSPYGEGWMVRIRMTSPDELDTLLSAAEYAELIK
ncbi:MAG: glycine cleavage system protein GcvH [Bacteroidales bacterium]|nr:glycine cleavage system protein GcvH [Bacteroidales bacterium]MCR5713858.1 glycine cleavage system protein GcvH [Bacteroidales bacterium]